ncbi:MAG: tetratricopeptide repeat protein [Bacteroidota bacterium]
MKNHFLLLLSLITLLAACTPSPEQQRNDISKLEAEYASNAVPELAQQLIDKYSAYTAAHPEDSANNLAYHVKSSRLHFMLNQMTEGAERIKAVFEDYGDEGVAAIKADLQETRKTMFNDSTGRIDLPKAAAFINATEAMANLRPDDPQTPVLLHQAGETARSTRDFQKAIAIYDQIYENYPDYEKAPQSLFLKAFTLDNDLKRPDEARKLYEEFLERYPEDDFADDTQFLLENLGKDDEEIIKSFQEKEVQ